MTGTQVAPLAELYFKVHPSTSSFAESPQAYLTKHSDSRYNNIATGALVFDISNPTVPRILLVQRAASDSMPNHWEIPGGGCDDEDESILYSVARELWEEAGLKTTSILHKVGDAHIFSTSSGKNICKFTFLVEVETNSDGGFDVTLDPKEHQRFVWATEQDVLAKTSGKVALQFTTQELVNTVIEAFREIERHV
jgi:8-oxo-dGTP pyrophosphatase MutT (NUDIX family)